MVTPPTFTGFNTATGVRVPVLPTCTFMSSIIVVDCWGENLKAIAPRGAFPTTPNLLKRFIGFIITTTPSTS